MTLSGPLDELDLVTRLERHDRLLPVRTLALERRGPHRGDLDVEDLLDREADLHLVRVRPHPERDRVLLFLLPHALLGHEGADQDHPGGTAHGASASSSAWRPARSNTTCRARRS